ncbi:MAG: SpoIVB peptidase [Bacillota bacterium]|nr:SpoIVB peptidase [Bacillota bacterium]
MIFKNKKKNIFVFLIICILIILLGYSQTLTVLPGQITLLEGDNFAYDFKSPFFVSVTPDKEGVISLISDKIKGKSINLAFSNPCSLKSLKQGCVNLKMSLFGIIPVKTMEINVVANREVVACGNTVGVKIRTKGLLVIGISDVEDADGNKNYPAKQCGIKPGDLILKANGNDLASINDFIEQINNSNGHSISVSIKHGQEIVNKEIKPVMSSDDSKYHLGLWVRDSTAGIGTLTFYDPNTNCFGALGHGITDLDTGELMTVKEGQILESTILSIKRGKQGAPGELKGIFMEDRKSLGVISKNSEFGIYGVLENNGASRLSGKTYPVALKTQVKEGPAKILSNIDGNSVEEYSVEIQKVSRQKLDSAKGMVIKVTDKKLLALSGGIVQGMSGSPIIQDGRIVGAVTHVLVNDPTRGYGIFIEKMMQNMVGGKQQVLEKAG